MRLLVWLARIVPRGVSYFFLSPSSLLKETFVQRTAEDRNGWQMAGERRLPRFPSIGYA